jgi:HK97 family phage major capsid protein
MAKTILELQQGVANIGEQITKVSDEIMEMATSANPDMGKLKQKEDEKTSLEKRFDILESERVKVEAEQKARLEKQKFTDSEDPQQKTIDAKASLIRKTMAKESVPADVRQALGDTDVTGGGKFLPSTLANELITEPIAKNPLRDISAVTNITNLELPRISFTLDDDDFISDMATAKEVKSKPETVEFGRHKFKVFADISETILLGTNTNLVQTVENYLKSGVAAKEKKVAFADTPKAGEEHMSFYSKKTDIKRVKGDDLYTAIKKAIADLHEDYRENSRIVMSYADYMDIIEVLANGSKDLYAAQPEQILGKPVTFTDAATTPIVGDFSYSHFNYDMNALYEMDKNIKTGMNSFVVTAWMDHQIKLSSAFRIAEGSGATTAKSGTKAPVNKD